MHMRIRAVRIENTCANLSAAGRPLQPCSGHALQIAIFINPQSPSPLSVPGPFLFSFRPRRSSNSKPYSYALGCAFNLVMPCVAICFRPYSIQSGIVVMIRTPTGCLATKLSVSARACHEGWARPQCGPDPSFEGLCVGEEAGPCFLEAMLQQSLGLDDELHMSRLSNVVHPCLYSSCAQLIGLS